MQLSLKRKIVLSVVAAITLTATILVVISYQSFKQDSWRAIQSESRNTLQAYAKGIAGWFHDKQLAIEGLKAEIERDPSLDVVPHLRQTLKSGGFGLSYYGNEKGEMYRQDPSLNKPGYDPRVRGWYKLAKSKNEAVTTDPYVSVTMKKLVVTLADPVRQNGQFIGVAASNLALDQLIHDVLNMKVLGNGYSILVNKKGTVVAHPNKDLILKPISEAIPQLNTQSLSQAADSGKPLFVDIDGKDKVVMGQNIAHTDWMLIMIMDRATLEQPMNSLLLHQIIIAVVILVVIALFISWVLSRQLKAIGDISEALAEIAEGDGDLTKRLDVNRQDEVGMLADRFNKFVDRLHAMVEKVHDVSIGLNEKADSAASAATKRSQQLKTQQDEITMVATAVTEMASATAEIAGNAENTAKNANQSVELGAEGYEQMQKSLKSINQLAEELTHAAGIVGDLEVHANEISTILSTIRAIAEQTNLLALNAAIEAARAGDQGRGFAVVADEVRVLSQRTHASTEEIQSKIEGLQKVTNNAVNVMQASHHLVENSVQDFNHTGDKLQMISESITMISDMAAQIASAAEEQSLVTADINGNTESVREVSDQMTHEAQLAAEEAQEVHRLMTELGREISRFKL
ncbi:methyl-accepting chemotaxis protein [Vibrio gazogenes]|uniref:methyl-accepting chemotaxis protein n=1 Tax=Vibrio gazogenes TaxID=687 RepID=UPI00097F29EE|nr:methyl-accepting chemotaxis protein [Vibrio gazogenes]USP12551.1 methyl-accepting chemotaxis protein [Vibrio gazogenes]SJN54035.1 Methyl-accepting chemotaxis protein PctC [Vibrio gazogenes]